MLVSIMGSGEVDRFTMFAREWAAMDISPFTWLASVDTQDGLLVTSIGFRRHLRVGSRDPVRLGHIIRER